MRKFLFIILAGLTVLSFNPLSVRADVWEAPAGDPPDNNRTRPLDKSSLFQVKEGEVRSKAGFFVGSADTLAADPSDVIQLLPAGQICLNGTCISNWNDTAYWTLSGSDIYNSNAGNVGINDTTPDYDLDIVGQLSVEGPTYPVGLFVRTTAVTGGSLGSLSGIASAVQSIARTSGNMTDGFGGGIVFNIADSGTSLIGNEVARIYARRDGSDSIGALEFFGGSGGNTALMTMRGSGNIGIGTASPNQLVHVYRATGNNAEIDIQSVAGASQHWGIYHDRTTEDLRFWNTDGSPSQNVLVLDNTGNVGIGTISPSQTLEVNGNIMGNFIGQDGLACSVGEILKKDALGLWSCEADSSGYWTEVPGAGELQYMYANEAGSIKIFGNDTENTDFPNRLVIGDGTNAELDQLCLQGIGAEECISTWADVEGVSYWTDAGSYVYANNLEGTSQFNIYDAEYGGVKIRNNNLQLDNNTLIYQTTDSGSSPVLINDQLMIGRRYDVGCGHYCGSGTDPGVDLADGENLIFGRVRSNPTGDTNQNLLRLQQGNGTDAEIDMFRVDLSGNLAVAEGNIGSTNLTIYADRDNSNESDQPSLTLSQDGGAVTGGLGYYGGSNDLTVKNIYSASLILGTNNTDRLIIENDGDLIMSGATLSNTQADNFYLNGNGSIQLRIDADNNSSAEFQVNNGINNTILSVDEDGDILAGLNDQGSITLGSNTTLRPYYLESTGSMIVRIDVDSDSASYFGVRGPGVNVNSFQVDEAGNVQLDGLISDRDSSALTVNDGLIVVGDVQLDGSLSDRDSSILTVNDGLLVSDQLTVNGGISGNSPTPRLNFNNYYDTTGNPSISHIKLYDYYGFGISASDLDVFSDQYIKFHSLNGVNNYDAVVINADTGDLTTEGDVTIGGNEIKNSDGVSSIQFSGGNVIIRLGN